MKENGSCVAQKEESCEGMMVKWAKGSNKNLRHRSGWFLGMKTKAGTGDGIRASNS